MLGQKLRGKRTPAKPAHSTTMWRASLMLQKSREAMARKEIDVDETSQSSVPKAATDRAAKQVTTTGWQREWSHSMIRFNYYYFLEFATVHLGSVLPCLLASLACSALPLMVGYLGCKKFGWWDASLVISLQRDAVDLHMVQFVITDTPSSLASLKSKMVYLSVTVLPKL